MPRGPRQLIQSYVEYAAGAARSCARSRFAKGPSVHTDWHNRNPDLVENHRYSVYVGLPLIAVGLFTPIPLNQRAEGIGQENGSVTFNHALSDEKPLQA